MSAESALPGDERSRAFLIDVKLFAWVEEEVIAGEAVRGWRVDELRLLVSQTDQVSRSFRDMSLSEQGSPRIAREKRRATHASPRGDVDEL